MVGGVLYSRFLEASWKATFALEVGSRIEFLVPADVFAFRCEGEALFFC
jgi:hypothetical protein